MKNPKFFQKYFSTINKLVSSVDDKELRNAAEICRAASKKGKKIIIVGNGGSAAMASHLSIDFTKAARIRAINFNEASLLTCFANDYGYERWVEHALDDYSDPGDVVILISSSGSSPNIINGAERARSLDLPLVTFSGFAEDNPLRSYGEVNFWVDSTDYNTVEMTHHIWTLSIVDYLRSMANQ